jgi:hypothetical protein
VIANGNRDAVDDIGLRGMRENQRADGRQWSEAFQNVCPMEKKY